MHFSLCTFPDAQVCPGLFTLQVCRQSVGRCNTLCIARCTVCILCTLHPICHRYKYNNTTRCCNNDKCVTLTNTRWTISLKFYNFAAIVHFVYAYQIGVRKTVCRACRIKLRTKSRRYEVLIISRIYLMKFAAWEHSDLSSNDQRDHFGFLLIFKLPTSHE